MDASSRFTINVDSLKKYWAILLFIIFSGSLYFQVLRIRFTMVIVGITIVAFVMSGWSIKKVNLNHCIVYLLFACLNIAFTFYNGVDWNDAIILILRFVYLIVIQSNMTELEYKKIFIDIMLFESVLSLACFLFANALSIGTLPLYTVEYGSVNGYLLTPYYTVGWVNTGVFGRNAGWFLEPGVHQIFINFAILFLLTDGDSCEYSRRKYWTYFIILTVALLTTQSTTGYLCYLVIMCAAMFMKKGNSLSYYSRNGESIEENDSSNKLTGRLRVIALIAVIVLLVVESTTGVIEDKLAGIDTGQSSGATRYNDTIVSYSMALSHPVLGYGLFNTVVSNELALYGVVNNSNGLASLLTGSGLVLGFAFLYMTYRGMKRSMPYGALFSILVFVFYLMCVNSEGGTISILIYLAFLFEWNTDEQEYLEE
ncbi:MAG: hypothetical protein LUH55_10990 [Bacteroides thetaiotaomicron]|nr:hypothetical protein [Bacteroides thetaiotaomicron]